MLYRPQSNRKQLLRGTEEVWLLWGSEIGHSCTYFIAACAGEPNPRNRTTKLPLDSDRSFRQSSKARFETADGSQARSAGQRWFGFLQFVRCIGNCEPEQPCVKSKSTLLCGSARGSCIILHFKKKVVLHFFYVSILKRWLVSSTVRTRERHRTWRWDCWTGISSEVCN